MASVYQEYWEGEATGTSVGTGNSAVATVNGTAPTHQTGIHGNCARWLYNTTVNTVVTTPWTARNSALIRFYFRLSSVAPSVTIPLIGVYSNTTARARFGVSNAAKPLTQNGTTSNAPPAGAPTLSANTWYRVEWEVNGTGGWQKFSIYLGDNTTAIYTSGNETFTNGTFTSIRIGTFLTNHGFVANAQNMEIDQIDFDDTTMPGPYGGLTPVDKTFEPRWNTNSVISDTFEPRWNIQAIISDAFEPRWNTRAVVNDTFEPRWNVYSLVADIFEPRWNTRSAVADTFEAQWNTAANTITPVERSFDVRWNTQAIISDVFEPRWNTRALISDTFEPRWHVYSAITDTFEPRWNTRALITDTFTPQWNTRALISDVFEPRWNTYSAVEDIATILWHTQAAVANTFEPRWNTYDPAEKTLTVQWNVLSALTEVNKGLTLQWNVATVALAAVTLMWLTEALDTWIEEENTVTPYDDESDPVIEYQYESSPATEYATSADATAWTDEENTVTEWVAL